MRRLVLLCQAQQRLLNILVEEKDLGWLPISTKVTLASAGVQHKDITCSIFRVFRFCSTTERNAKGWQKQEAWEIPKMLLRGCCVAQDLCTSGYFSVKNKTQNNTTNPNCVTYLPQMVDSGIMFFKELRALGPWIQPSKQFSH